MLDAFGPGLLFLTRTDVANSTPINIGSANEFNVDFAGNIKELFGSNQLPIDAARGTIKVTGKAKAATISGLAWNAAFFGNNFSTGGFKWNVGEAASVPASTPWTVTVTNAANFDKDLGVVFDATGIPLVKVASAPATGQYSVSAVGVYTFASADANKAVLITYTSTVTTGQTLTISNQLIGSAPIFQLDYYTSRNNKAFVARYNSVQCNKLSFAAKLEDFIMPELEFSMFVDASNTLGKLVFPEVS
jgi:hypothetical protein